MTEPRLGNNSCLEQRLVELRARDVGVYGSMLWTVADVTEIRESLGMPVISTTEAETFLRNLEKELGEVQSRAARNCLESYIDQADLYKREP